MDTTLLYIRKRQLVYELKQLGIYSIAIFAIVVSVIYYTYTVYQDTVFALLITASIAISCYTFHSFRKDKEFLYLHSGSYHFSLYLEYSIFTFPLILMCLFTSQWYCFFILQIILLIIPLSKITIKERTIFRNLSRLIPAFYFEWLSGIRQKYLQIIFVYILALALSWVKILPLFLLWYLTLIISSFYNEFESVVILREGNKSSRDFLRKKLLKHSILLIFFYLPVLIINNLFNPDFIILNLGLLLSQIALLIFVMCFKYSNYVPNQIQYGNNLLVILVSLCASIPVFLPVPLIIAYKYYSNAKNNLKEYFND